MESSPYVSTPEDSRRDYRYGLYYHKQTAPDGAIYTKPLIVLRNRYGDVARFTRLHQFADASASKLFVPIASSGKERLYHICSMLNYVVIEKYEEFGVDHVFSVTREPLTAFFQSYATEPDNRGNQRNQIAVEKCINNVAEFFRKLKRHYGEAVAMNLNELFSEQLSVGRNGRRIIKRVPQFQVHGVSKQSRVFRELPTKAFKILLPLAFRYASDIALALCLQAFAGLRAGEALNVRQNGVKLTRVGSFARKIEIDLTRELPLRSDGVEVGRIKKERVQCVYPPFVQAFSVVYERHREWLRAHPFEAEYCPMFVNSRGKAMTYDAYRERFAVLVDDYFRPALLRSDDAELKLYGQLLYENRLGLHSLRHWFSVQLVLHGEDIAQIQFWRGDKSPESAFAYLQNKGDLVRELETGSELLTEIIMAEGEFLLGNKL